MNGHGRHAKQSVRRPNEMHQLIQGDCLDVLQSIDRVTTLLADPPDNIGLRYNAYRDRCPDTDYIDLLRKWLHAFVEKAKTVWFSYNSRWTFHVGPHRNRTGGPIRKVDRGQALCPDIYIWTTQP